MRIDSHSCFAALILVLLCTLGCDQHPKGDELTADRNVAAQKSRNSPPPQATKILDDFQAIKEALNANKADYHSIWDNIKGLEDNLTDKQYLYYSCLAKMCSEGLYQEAFALITDSIGPGKRREGMITFLIGSNKIPLKYILELRKSLNDDGDRSAIDSGLGGAIANLDNLDDLTPEVAKSLGDNAGKILLSGFSLYLQRAKMRRIDTDSDVSKIVEIADELASETGLGPEFRFSLLKDLAKSSPFVVWKLIQSDSLLGRPELRSAVATEMARNDPKRAMEVVAESPASDEIRIIFAGWLRLEHSEASEWFEVNTANLSKQAVGQVYSAFAENFANASNFDLASEWVNKIEDPALKAKLEERVWMKQRDKIRSETKKDPVGTLNSILSGQSEHGVQWAEEAMNSWIIEHPDAAENWYLSNWSAMPRLKAQYIAAAYAREAIRQADLDTADEWIAFIDDPTIKQRIITVRQSEQRTKDVNR